MSDVCSVWIDDDAVDISLRSPSGQLVRLNRKPDEQLALSLRRLALSLQKAEQKNHKGTKASEDPVAALVGPRGQPVPADALNKIAWQHGSTLTLTLPAGGTSTVWTIERDLPLCAAITIPELPLAGHPLCAQAELRFASGALWEWSRATATGESVILSRGRERSSYVPTATDVGCKLSVSVTPTRASDASARESIGAAVTATCPFSVVAVAEEIFAPVEARAAQLPPLPRASGLRVVSYNVLWGVSADSAAKRGGGPRAAARAPQPAAPAVIRELAQLPVPIYAAAYRQHVLGAELERYAADVICLQEMTEAPFAALAARLAPLGLAGEYARPEARAGATHELATLWREAKLLREAGATWRVGSLLDAPHSTALREELERASPALAAFVRSQPHTAQATLLRARDGGRPLLVLNVHLVQNTLAANARTLQALLVLRQAEAWASSLRLDAPCARVVCGDFNSYHPGDGVLAYLSGREVPADSYEWVYGRGLGRRPARASAQCGADVGRGEACPHPPMAGELLCWDHRCPPCGRAKANKWPTCFACAQAPLAAAHADLAAPCLAARGAAAAPPDGAFFAPALALPAGRGLCNAYEEATGTPAFAALPFRPSTGQPTAHPWIECRDHIFCSRDLRVTAALPPPPDLDSLRGMPNLTWPSDHAALVADLEWAPEAPVAPAQPEPKRQRTDPGCRADGVRNPLDPRAQRSWGETSLGRALPRT